jgi:hypothetical protein
MQCLICCQGNTCGVELTTDELGKFSGQGLAIQRQADQTYYFSQSCPQLHADGCVIYFDGQPKDCSSYQCRTLKQLLNGKIDLTTAQQRVERVKQQIGVVLEELQPGKPEKTDLQDLIQSWLKEKRFEQDPPLLNAIRNLLTDIDRDFHKQKRLLPKLPSKQKGTADKSNSQVP